MIMPYMLSATPQANHQLRVWRVEKLRWLILLLVEASPE
jgi:hypothetical protein